MYKVVSLDIPCGAEVGSLLPHIASLVLYLEQKRKRKRKRPSSLLLSRSYRGRVEYTRYMYVVSIHVIASFSEDDEKRKKVEKKRKKERTQQKLKRGTPINTTISMSK